MHPHLVPRWSAATVLLAIATVGAGLRLWHGLLLDHWQNNLAGLGLSAGLAVALALLLRSRVSASPAPGHDDRLPPGAAVAVAASAIVLLVLFQASYLGVISDARDYYIQARSLVIDGDLDMGSREIARMSGRGQAAYYPIGSALLWSPWLAACHVYLGVLNALGGEFPRDGYARPYFVSVGLATIAYGLVALVLILRVLRMYFSTALAITAALTLFAGSFIVWYLTVEPAMTHGTSLFAVTLFLYLWHRTRDSRTTGQWMVVGLAAGLMAIVRWQDALFATVLVFDAVRDYWRVWRSRVMQFGAAVGRHAGGLAGIGLALTPQLLLWGGQQVEATGLPDGEFRIRWFDPGPFNVLFSPNHGLFASTPILYLAALGLLPFIRRAPRVGMALLTAFAAQVYVNSVLLVWWGGSGFGARRFAGCALVFALGLGAALDWIRARPRVAMAIVLVPFVAINLSLMQEIRNGRLPSGEGLTAAEMLGAIYQRVGNPFSFPANWLFSRDHHGESPATYDRLGERTFGLLRVDVGHPDDDVFLTYGWSDREDEGGLTFRWATGADAGVAVPLREANDGLLTFRAQPFVWPQSPAPRLDILINDMPLGSIVMEHAWHEYAISVPVALLRRNLNHVNFRFAYAQSPRSLGLNDDGRDLSVRFDFVELRRFPRSLTDNGN